MEKMVQNLHLHYTMQQHFMQAYNNYATVLLKFIYIYSITKKYYKRLNCTKRSRNEKGCSDTHTVLIVTEIEIVNFLPGGLAGL